MFVCDIAEVGEETHIWNGDKLLFEGKYSKDNPYAKRKVYGVGYEEEIGRNQKNGGVLLNLND